MGARGSNMKYFWIYLLIFFTAAFVLIYISSTSQMEIQQKSDELAQQTTHAQGIESRMGELTKTNEELRNENEKLTANLSLKEQEITDFKEKNDILIRAALYLENDQSEEAKALLETITDTESMTEPQKTLYQSLTEQVK